MFIKFPLLLLAGISLSIGAPAFSQANNDSTVDLRPDEKQSVVCKLVVKMLNTGNYKKVAMNDSLSSLVFNRYLKALDENHSYLLASDVAGFERYKTELDEDLTNGELSAVFAMYNIYKNRYQSRLRYSIEQLNAKFDFTEKDVFVLDRRKLPFVKTEDKMNTLWNQRVKYDLLNLQLQSPDIIKNKEVLKKKYQYLLDQAGKTSSQDVFQLLMNSFTASVDPHVAYFNPFNAEQFNVGLSRALEGIGATLIIENEYVTIKGLTPGGPAYKTKLLNPDDRIVAIAQGINGEFQDIVGWRLDNVIALIRGRKGSIVKLKVLAKGKTTTDVPQIVEIVREKIILADQSAKQEVRTYKINDKEVRIGVVSIPAFYLDVKAYLAGENNYKSTTRDVKLLLDTLKQKQVDAIMIDLRGNGGGSLNEAISLTGLFIKSGPVVQVRDAQNHIQMNWDQDTSVYYNGPLAVLVDRTSASASEIFSGAIQDYGRGLILGAQTYGKGSVQTQYSLDKIISKNSVPTEPASVVVGNQSQFGQINLTIGKFYRINGSSTQHKGVIPDIQLPSFIAASKYGEDNEPSSMPWDTIGKSNYVRVGSFANVIPILANLYQKRCQTNLAYKAFNASVEAYKRYEAPASVPLNEQELKRIKDINANQILERDNQLRVAVGLSALKKGQVKSKTDDLDFMKSEAGQILTDYVILTKPSSL